jgi:hypothetical protein
VTLAANNLATQVTADTSVINFGTTSIVVDATVNGETKTVTANAEAPQVVVTTDTGAVVSTTTNVNLSKVDAVIPVDLTPTAVKPGLAPLAVREASAPAVTTTIETATTTSSTVAGTTTLPSRATTTTVKPTSGTYAPASATTTTVRAPTTTVTSPTTTRAPTTTVPTTVAANKVTLKFIVVGTGWNPTVKINTGKEIYDQDYGNMDLICTSASTCQGATTTIPYGNYFFFDISTDQNQSYVSFGDGAGYSNVQTRIMSYRICDSSYPGYASKTCEIILYKTNPLYG